MAPSSLPRDIDYSGLSHLLPPRRADAHKGDFGHVLVAGGAPGMGGASLLAAEAAARCGAGLVSVATHPAHAAAFLSRRPELMVRGLKDPDEFAALAERASVLVLGPGLGQSAWSQALYRSAIDCAQALELPLVLDADGLNLLARGAAPESLPECLILTPHPAEAGRLLGRSTREVQSDRPAAAAALLAGYGGVAVLKGAGSLVAYRQSGRLCLDRCRDGNPGMASGGMGDILSGVLGALLAQGLDAADAARLGVCLHARAGDEAARDGERGLLAGDLLPWLRRLANPRAQIHD